MVLTSIDFLDLLLSLVYSLIILFVASRIKVSIRNKAYSRFFIPFIGFKIVYTILFVVIHIFYYKGGDTFLYFSGSKFISDQMLNSPNLFFSYLFGGKEAFSQFTYSENFGVLYAFNDSTTLVQSQIGSIFSILSFNHFLTTSILFSMFFAMGIWALYSTLCNLYPKLYKVFAIGVLFYPTIGMWGSGLLKDPVVIAAIGWFFQGVYNISERKKTIRSVIQIVISTILCLQLKAYVLYTFVPAMLIWLQARFSNNIKSSLVRYLFTPVIIIGMGIGGYFFLLNVSQSAGKYSLDNVQEIAEGFQDWHTYLAETRGQTGYSLGEVNFTALGVLQKSPEALFVTYYRPTPLEIRNFATAFESVQSTVLLLLTIYIFFRIGPTKFFRTMLSNKEARAFMIFAIFLGVAVGLTSYNFGALSRYKIPCLPFFTASLAIIYYTGKRKSPLRNLTTAKYRNNYA